MGNWEDLQTKYMWKTRGENCHICDAMAGRVYTYDTWISSAVLPGFHLHCNCYLKKVPESTPLSSKDVFGSDFDLMRDNHYFLLFNTNPGWLPYNRYMSTQIEKAQKESGSSIGEVLKSILQSGKSDVFNSSVFSSWNQFFTWRVFKSSQVNQNIDGTYSKSLTPQAATPKALKPSQTYKYTYQQLRHWGGY
jgi:hypothetical protein